MARISTYPNDTYVTGRDKWIGSDADNNYITKNFTSNAVAAYFNRSAIIDTGQFAWSFIPYSDTQPQPEKTFMKIDWVDDTININNLAGVLRVSALTIANTTPGDFMVNEWIGGNILVHFPGAPSAYSIYTVDSLVLDPDSSWFYLMTLTFVSGESFVIQEDESVVMGYFSEVGTVNGVTATSPLFSSGGENPNITIQVANTSQSGYLTNTDWNTFNAKQGALTLTTTGSSGAATLIGNTLNIPIYTNALTAYVPYTGATDDVNLGLFDLYTAKVWLYDEPNGAYGSMELTDGVLHFEDVDGHSMVTMEDGYLTIANASTIRALLNVTGLTVNRDYAFPNASGTLALTSDLPVNPITGSGTVNYVPKFDTTSSIANSNIQDSGSLITLGSDTTISSGALGIGTTDFVAYNLRAKKNITGALTAYGIMSDGTIQSDVTNVRMFNSRPTTVDSSFTLPVLSHYLAQQGTFGASSTVTNQYGFLVDTSLIGATNNYGFRGQIPSGTNRWNIYMDGTADNYLAGNLGIGSSILTGRNLLVSANITGATISVGVTSNGTIQSDVSNGRAFSTGVSVAASSTILGLYHYSATQGTLGAGATIDSQFGFFAASTLIGATNNYGFYGQLAAATGTWNLYMAGTANNYLGGALGIGTTTLAGYNLRLNLNITGSVSSIAFYNSGTIQSDVTSSAYYNRTLAATQATSFTLTNIYHYGATQGTFGAGSTVTNQFGFLVASSLTGATNNYAFAGQLAAATNTWNLYNSGTASNYMAGALGIGSTILTGINLRVGKNITGSVSSHGVFQDGQVQSDVTSDGYGFRNTLNTQAASFNLTNYWHFTARQATIGAGSSVTSQQGFHADATLIGATNNYGFRGGLTSATGRWNIYMDGDAENFILGNVGIGVSPSRVSSGPILTSTLTNGGSGYVDGTYTDVAVTAISSNGTGALYTIVVSGGIVTSAILTWAGTSYKVGNTITVSNTLLGGTGSGLIITVDTVDSSPLKISNVNGGDITLYRSDTGLSLGENIGTIKFESNDASTKASGILAEIGAFGQGTVGGAYLSFYTSLAGGALTEQVRIGSGGQVGIGTTSLTGINLAVQKNITGASISYGITSLGQIQTDVTTARYFYTAPSQISGATTTTIQHFFANQGTFSGTVTQQMGFYVASTLTGATSNFGFRGDLASATNTWNIYMAGTAQNYLAGALSIGVATANASALFQVDSTTKGALFPRMTTTQKNAISSPATGLVVFDTTLGKLCVFSTTWQTISSV